MEEEEFMKQKPAFPIPEHADINHIGRNGMTLRDYFAAKAMQGMMSTESEISVYKEEYVSERSYMIADAMLKERSKS